MQYVINTLINALHVIKGNKDMIIAITAIVSVIIAIVTLISSSNNILLSHRPYVSVENFAWKERDGGVHNNEKGFMLLCLNAPARIVSEQYEYFIIENGKVLEQKDVQKTGEQIVYPAEKTQYTRRTAIDILEIAKNLKSNQELRRKAKVAYKWLSSNKQYFFNSEQRFDNRENIWRIISQEAN